MEKWNLTGNYHKLENIYIKKLLDIVSSYPTKNGYIGKPFVLTKMKLTVQWVVLLQLLGTGTAYLHEVRYTAILLHESGQIILK